MNAHFCNLYVPIQKIKKTTPIYINQKNNILLQNQIIENGEEFSYRGVTCKGKNH
jgi:hypothetical protein